MSGCGWRWTSYPWKDSSVVTVRRLDQKEVGLFVKGSVNIVMDWWTLQWLGEHLIKKNIGSTPPRCSLGLSCQSSAPPSWSSGTWECQISFIFLYYSCQRINLGSGLFSRRRRWWSPWSRRTRLGSPSSYEPPSIHRRSPFDIQQIASET